MARNDKGLHSVRGTALREALRWHSQDDDTVLSALYEQLPTRAQEALDRHAPFLGVIPAGWYDTATVDIVLDRIARVHPSRSLESFADALAEAIMSATLTGIYRKLFKWMATPARYAKYCDRMWRLYYDSGRMEVELDEAGKSASCTISGWGGHSPTLCELNRAAANELYRAMGLGQVGTTRTACVSDGDPSCCFVTRWE